MWPKLAVLSLLAFLIGCGGGTGSTTQYTVDFDLAAPSSANRGETIEVTATGALALAGPRLTISFPTEWNEGPAVFYLDGSTPWVKSCQVTIPDSSPLGEFWIKATLSYDADDGETRYRGTERVKVTVTGP